MGRSGVTVRVALLGGGGHAAVVIEAMRAAGQMPAFILDPNRDLWGNNVLGVPVLGGDEQLFSGDANHFIVTLGAVNTTNGRSHLFEQGVAAGLAPLTVVHPSAVL